MNTILRQVRFPLKLKLLTLMILLISSSLIIFVGIALNIFKQDKSAYIYESLLNKASSEQIILSQKLKLLSDTGTLNIKNGNLYYADVDVSELLFKELSRESSYVLKILIPIQSKMYQWSNNKLELISEAEYQAFSPLLTQSLNSAVKEVEVNRIKWLYAYDYNPQMNFAYIVGLTQDKAFEATTYLIHKSIYYGIFILGLSMILSVFLAKPLTIQLEKLFGMTQEIAKGNFKTRVSIKGQDEVGALSDSINDMANKIVVYMEEMKEKARLENEVEVAKLVQSSFFPESNSNDEIFGYFEPATECGGDWWGYFNHGDWRIIFIADATGHGVPAALLTATMNCCKTNLSFIMETKPEIISRPDEILRLMNLAVCGAGKEIQVTCFVACYNKKTSEFIYSNASHPSPLFWQNTGKEISKESFKPLTEANGPRLGQQADAVFEKTMIKLQSQDMFFFYTDGLTEATDKEGTRWGIRRLVKSLIEHHTNSHKEIVDIVVNDLKSFTNSQIMSDDLTAVIMKVT